MASNCGPSFGICAVRLTKVDEVGNVIAGSNSYVSDKLISVAVNVNKETGNTFTARNGCGCNIARFKAADTFNWFEFVFTQAALEPEMQAFLLGADVIKNSGDEVGVAFPGALACDAAEPAVAFEFWTKNISGSGQDPTYPWVHFCFPMTVWSLGDNTFEEAFAQPVVNGFSRTNDQWGDGPYGDGPPDSTAIPEGGWWKTADDPPVASCATENVTATS